MTTFSHVMAADNYYLLPSYDDTLRSGEPNEFFGTRSIIGGPYILDRSTIILVEKVCGEPPWLEEKLLLVFGTRRLADEFSLGVECCRVFAE